MAFSRKRLGFVCPWARLEAILGQRQFLYLFLIGAMGGELGNLFLMPSDALLYGTTGGVAAVLIAYATILPEMELIAWRSRFFGLQIKAKHFAYVVAFVSLVMPMVDRHGALIHSAIPGGLAGGWLYVHLARLRTSVVVRAKTEAPAGKRRALETNDRG